MVKSSRVINEVYFLRAIACLAVVLLHSVSSALLMDVNPDKETLMRIIQLLLMFGTPTFVFISELLISHSYPNNLPDGFYRKRVKFILVPYILMGLFYAMFSSWYTGNLNVNVFISQAIKNVFFGGYHGYFVLIIFQFYILHFVFQKYLVKRFSPRVIIGVSLLINIIYLMAFNIIRLPESTPVYLRNFWGDDFKLLFLAWLFYFSVAYYCGKNFNSVKEWVGNHFVKIFILLILTMILLLFDYFVLGFESIHSKRFDIIFYTIAVIGVLVYLAFKKSQVPQLIMLVSRYSFGIYLVHPFVIKLLERFEVLPKGNTALFVLSTFICALFCSIFLTYLLNKTKVGVYFVGKVKHNRSPYNKSLSQVS